MVGSGNYYRDTTKTLHPPSPPVINTGRLADSSSRESFVFVYINQLREYQLIFSWSNVQILISPRDL